MLLSYSEDRIKLMTSSNVWVAWLITGISIQQRATYTPHLDIHPFPQDCPQMLRNNQVFSYHRIIMLYNLLLASSELSRGRMPDQK